MSAVALAQAGCKGLSPPHRRIRYAWRDIMQPAHIMQPERHQRHEMTLLTVTTRLNMTGCFLTTAKLIEKQNDGRNDGRKETRKTHCRSMVFR